MLPTNDRRSERWNGKERIIRECEKMVLLTVANTASQTAHGQKTLKVTSLILLAERKRELWFLKMNKIK